MVGVLQAGNQRRERARDSWDGGIQRGAGVSKQFVTCGRIVLRQAQALDLGACCRRPKRLRRRDDVGALVAALVVEARQSAHFPLPELTPVGGGVHAVV